MKKELEPCPVCGGGGVLTHGSLCVIVRCRECGLSGLYPQDWNLLSRAVRIAEAAKNYVNVWLNDGRSLINECAHTEMVQLVKKEVRDGS